MIKREPPCDYCLDEKCGGTRACDCSTCDINHCCPKVLWPTIRITTRCTQRCGHCCYDCSPDRDDMMTLETAREVRTFLDANRIQIITLMGGEVFCHPQWADIVPLLAEGRQFVRLVTNGDWADGSGTFLDGLEGLQDRMVVSISKDRWHTNARVEAALQECEDRGFVTKVTTESEDNLDNIVPIGRGEFHFGFYSMMGCHCHNPENHYHFLIDEQGVVYKCGLGSWDYTSVQRHLDGSFAPRFKEFNQAFYGSFVGSCAHCIRAWSHVVRKEGTG